MADLKLNLNLSCSWCPPLSLLLAIMTTERITRSSYANNLETIVAGSYSVALPDSRTQNIKHITWQATSSFHEDLALEKYFVLTPHGTDWWRKGAFACRTMRKPIWSWTCQTLRECSLPRKGSVEQIFMFATIGHCTSFGWFASTVCTAK